MALIGSVASTTSRSPGAIAPTATCVFIAGSGHFTDLCVSNVIRMAGLSPGDGIALASSRPRELLGLPVTTIEAGGPADLMLFDWTEAGQLHVRAVV